MRSRAVRPKAKRDPKLASHRRQAAENRVRVSDSTSAALKALADKQGMSIDLTIEYLLLFYDLKMLDLLIEKLKRRYDTEGFTALELNQLSVLYTLMQLLDKKLGLH